jgi:hypothetical protein
MPTRRHVHKRTISADVYERDDGLWDVEAELIDTKAKDFRLATGVRPAGEPIHHMRLTITIDTSLNVVAAAAESVRVPYPGHCDAIAPDYRQLVGLNLMRNFRHDVRERLGGIHGCTHITELTNVIPTAVVQAFAGEVFRTRDGSADDPAPGAPVPADQKPFQLDRFHALRTDGAAVAEFYPRWYRGDAAAQAVAPQPFPQTDSKVERSL